MTKFKVGDKVQTTEAWAKKYYYGIVVGVDSHYIKADWYQKNGEVHRQDYHYRTLILLDSSPKKKGLCKFLDKVKKEYSNA